MRETLARIAALTVVGLIVALAGAVAWRDTRAGRTAGTVSPSPATASAPVGPPREALPAARLARGAELFRGHGCRSCHSLAGQGNPGLPLDDVGRRRSAAEIGPWITGVGLPTDSLPAAVRRRKVGYAEMSVEDLTALAAFLAAQRADPP